MDRSFSSGIQKNVSMSKKEFRTGWKTLLACFIGMSISFPSLFVYTSGIWVTHWQDEFGWSRGEIGVGQGLVYLVVVLGTPFIGVFIDKFGFKRIGTVSLILYGSCFYLYSIMDGSLTMFYLLSVLIALLALPSSPIGFTRAINAWFKVNRGLALGIILSAIGLGAIIIPKFLTPYIAVEGWRDGQFILFLIVMIGVPFVWMLLKDPPGASFHNQENNMNGVSLQSAMKSRSFWMVGLIFFLVSSAMLGLIPGFIPMLLDEGLSPTEAGGFMAILGLSVVLARIVIGFLIDRFFAPYVAITVFAFAAFGCLSIGLWQTQFVLIGAITIGFAIGAEVDLVSFLSVKYFGMKYYGRIFGVLYSLFVCGAVVSPAVVGYSWDVTGDYDVAFLLAVGIISIAIMITACLPKFSET